MQKLLLQLLGFILSVAVLSGCQSLEELYRAGEYEKAFRAADRRLNKKAQDQQALRVLEQSLVVLIERGQEDFARWSATTQPTQWEKALDVIAVMDGYLDVAKKHLPTAYAIDQETWWAQALVLEEQLFYHYFEQGRSKLGISQQNDDAALGQKAYRDFERAIHYQREEYAGIEQLPAYREAAIKAGTVYYMVSIDDGFNIGLGVDVERAFGDLSAVGGVFLKVEQQFIASGGDCVIEIEFDEFETTFQENSSRQDFQQRIIVGYDLQTDTSGATIEIPIYEDVAGAVETVTSTKTGSWEVDVDITRSTHNCQLFGDSFRGEASSTIEFYRTTGDERAIPDQYFENDAFEHASDEELAEEILYDLVDLIFAEYFNTY